MFDIFSATGFLVHTPCGPRKSGMPESVEMPAPVSTTMRRAPVTHSLTCSTNLRHLDLAAAAGDRRQRALRHHDLRCRLAAHLLQLLHGALDRLARELAELLGRFLERAGADLEADRQRACGREHLGFADVEHGTRLIALAVLLHRREAPDGADAPVGEDLFEEQPVRIDFDVVGGLGFGRHWISKDAAGSEARAPSRRDSSARRDSRPRLRRSSTSTAAPASPPPAHSTPADSNSPASSR